MNAPRSARLTTRRVYIAGHRGLVRSLLRTFAGAEFLLVRSRAELDLTDRAATFDFVLESRPQVVIGKRPGRLTSWPATPTRPISVGKPPVRSTCWMPPWRRGCRGTFLGSSCIYRNSPHSRHGERAARRSLEPTRNAYAIAKSPASLAVRRCTANMACGSACHQPVRARRQLSPSGSHLRRHSSAADEAKASGAP